MNRHAHLPRRRFSAEQKVAMVREAMQPDRSIAEVGRLYDVNQNQLSRWIREYRDGAAWSNQTLVPVELVETDVSTSAWFDADAQEDAVPLWELLDAEGGSKIESLPVQPAGIFRIGGLCFLYSFHRGLVLMTLYVGIKQSIKLIRRNGVRVSHD